MKCPFCNHQWRATAQELVEELAEGPVMRNNSLRTIDDDDLLFLTEKE